MSTTGQAGGRRSSNLPSYSEIAQKLAVGLCEGGCNFPPKTHETGLFSMPDYRVHWMPRAPTRRGIRNFLKIASLVDSKARSGPLWARLYWCNWHARLLGASLQLRFLDAWAAQDKARALYDLNRHRPAAADRELARKVRRWART